MAVPAWRLIGDSAQNIRIGVRVNWANDPRYRAMAAIRRCPATAASKGLRAGNEIQLILYGLISDPGLKSHHISAISAAIDDLPGDFQERAAAQEIPCGYAAPVPSSPHPAIFEMLIP